MIMMRFKSVRRGILALVLLHQSGEFVKQVMGIMRSRRSFRMILDTKYRLATVSKALHSLVIQIYMRQFDFGIAQRVWIYRETMVLRRNLHFPGQAIQHRVVRAMMPELQLECLPAK